MMFDTLISAAETAALLARGEVAVFDCSFDLGDVGAGRVAYYEGHIPGARYLDLERDLSGAPDGSNGRHPLPERGALERTLRGVGLHGGQQVVGYDRSGGIYAARLWWLLRWLGHDKVAVLDGGLAAWQESGGGLEANDAPAAAPGDFVAEAEPAAATMSAADLLAGRWLVVDARSPERFAGAPHPLDAVAGHIPGARNRWFADNLGHDGRFRAPAELAAGFGAVLGATPVERVVLQCGSGVTACHNALAMTHAGLPGARLYPGSWSEWAADPTRPIAKG